MSEENLLRLIAEFKTDNSQALKNVYQEHAAYCISNLLKVHSCSREDAEDIFTDAVLNFRDKLITGHIKELTTVRSYIFATCKNMFLAGRKRNRRITNISSDEQFAHLAFIADTSDAWIEQQQLSEILEKSLAGLPDKCRDLLRAFYFDRISLEEIAVRYGMANSNVAKVSKARCFMKLVELFKAEQKKSVNAIEPTR